MCLSVSPSRYPTIMRSETLVKHLQINISSTLTLCSLCVCLAVLLYKNVDINCRFVTFNTRLNTLCVPTKTNRTDNSYFFILFFLYLLLFEYYFIVLLPFEFLNVHLDTRWIKKKSVILVNNFHRKITSITLHAYYRINHLGYISIFL